MIRITRFDKSHTYNLDIKMIGITHKKIRSTCKRYEVCNFNVGLCARKHAFCVCIQ